MYMCTTCMSAEVGRSWAISCYSCDHHWLRELGFIWLTLDTNSYSVVYVYVHVHVLQDPHLPIGNHCLCTYKSMHMYIVQVDSLYAHMHTCTCLHPA